MNTKEKHIRENENREKREERENELNVDLIEKSPEAKGRERRNETTRKNNRLWLWLSVIILVAILLWWLFSEGMLMDLIGASNG